MTFMLTRQDLWSLEEYSEKRSKFRQKVLEHKRNRYVSLGEHLRLCFEDALTIKYQIQEMLRIERIFDPAGIEEELNAYNPLIPTGQNWKATLMIEYEDANERKDRLSSLIGIESEIWIQVESCEAVYPIADEDLDRTSDTKTSAVHFLRFELTPDMILGVKENHSISIGVSHPNFPMTKTQLKREVRDTLANDLVLA